MSGDQNFWGVVLEAILFQLKDRLHSTFLFSVYSLPGTLCHELAHFITSLLLLGKPQRMTLIPIDNGGGSITLGSVTSRNLVAFNTFPISLAPLLMVPVAYHAYSRWFFWFPRDFIHSLGLYLVLFSLLSASLPSTGDWRIAFRNPIAAFIWSLLIIGISLVVKKVKN